MQKPRNNKNQPNKEQNAALSRAQKNIYRQAALAVLTLVLTMVIVFAMTSAWYTNIVQTSGLVFEAESWGFEGEIQIQDTPIVAAPGDEGIVSLTVSNDSDTITAVSVNISKAAMAQPLQKRLFFYVDTQHTRNNETMERVYLNNQESYTYTLFSQGKLTLTEQLHNDAQIKWQWVYDVLGYYVMGEYDAASGTMREIEYLRPIEYDYDASTSTFVTDKDNNLSLVLSTVDGKTTVAEFLRELSEKDGYEGIIDITDPTKVYGNYYAVEVDPDIDGNARGVFAYLCNYAEIEQATKDDTELGVAAYEAAKIPGADKSQFTFEAKMTLSAQKSDNTVVPVTTLASLQQAIENPVADVIQLTNDVNITTTPLTIPENSRIMLDLNGKTIQFNGNNAENNTIAIKAEPGSSLTMINGSLAGTEKKDPTTGDTLKLEDYAVYAIGSEVVFSDVTVDNFSYGFYVGDNLQDNVLDSRVYISKCNITTDDYSLYVQGNGLLSDQKTQIVIEDSTLTSDSLTITGNGTVTGNGRWGTDIQIINSKILSNVRDDLLPGAAIYQPQPFSTLSVYNSEISGYTGIAIKGGSVSITDSVVTGLGAFKPASDTNKSGFTDTGDAVYIECNYPYDISLEIHQTDTVGNKATLLDSKYSYALQLSNADALNAYVQIDGGSFTQIARTATVDGVSYVIPKASEYLLPYLAEGFVFSDKENTSTVTAAPAAES